MRNTSPNINRYWADLIIEELVRLGIRQFFVAPGSRNAPLVTALAQREDASAMVHFDERGAAFAALGYGRAGDLPAAVITTSGSAVANCFPAVVEASESETPLLILSADRPPELKDTGANQAIDQTHIFGRYTRWFFEVPTPTPEIAPTAVLTTIDQAVHRTVSPPGGPVHLNFLFREPLAPSLVPFESDESGLRDWLNSKQPFMRYSRSRPLPDEDTLVELRNRLGAAKRGAVVVGALTHDEDVQAIADFAYGTDWPVLADVTSQLRLGRQHPGIVAYPHHVCRALKEPHADVLLRFGGAISSKEILAFVEQAEWGASIAPTPRRRDPAHRIRLHIQSDPAAVLSRLSSRVGNGLNELSSGRREESVDKLLDERLLEGPVSEPGVARLVTRLTPAGQSLFLGSSMPIRDLDMFASRDGGRLLVTANRGASGIDGAIASAAGHAVKSGRSTTAVIGDLAALHDLNSLALAKRTGLKLIVVNNNGGGIFSFLPIADHRDVFTPWFDAPHGLSFASAAALFGIRYEQIEEMRELERIYLEALDTSEPLLIEVNTDAGENLSLHRELGALMTDKLAG